MASKQIKKLPHPKHFAIKILRYMLAGSIVLIFSLVMGTVGYHYYFRVGWIDGLYNASMILTGMGPVDPAPDNSAKIFGSVYSIYSGVAFLTSVAIIFSPIVHRFLHKFRIEIEE